MAETGFRLRVDRTMVANAFLESRRRTSESAAASTRCSRRFHDGSERFGSLPLGRHPRQRENDLRRLASFAGRLPFHCLRNMAQAICMMWARSNLGMPLAVAGTDLFGICSVPCELLCCTLGIMNVLQRVNLCGT